MTRTFSIIVAALAVSCFPVAPAGAASAGLGGDWIFHVDWGQLKYDMLCHIADDAGKLTGICQGYSGSLHRARGAIDPTSLKFSYSTNFMQYDISVEYDGTRFSGGGVTGSVRAGTTFGDFYGSAPTTFSDNSSGWSLHTRLSGLKDYDLFCSFAQNDKSLSGPCVTAGGPVMLPAGSIAGTQVAFSYLTGQVRSQFTGTFDGDDRIEGTATSDIGGSATFDARRR